MELEMRKSTPETRAAAFERALTSLRLEGIVLEDNAKFNSLRDAYIGGTLTMSQIIEETSAMYTQEPISHHG
jgi:hypothetical protein